MMIWMRTLHSSQMCMLSMREQEVVQDAEKSRVSCPRVCSLLILRTLSRSRVHLVLVLVLIFVGLKGLAPNFHTTGNFNSSVDHRHGCSPTSLHNLKMKRKKLFVHSSFVMCFSSPAYQHGILQVSEGEQVESLGKDLRGEAAY